MLFIYLKGFDVAEGGGIALISQIIQKQLKIDVSVLMGANLANEIADEKFSETTIGKFFFLWIFCFYFYIIKYFYLGCRDKKIGQILKDVIQTDYFRVSVVDDVEAVEACGALKVFNLYSLNKSFFIL